MGGQESEFKALEEQRKVLCCMHDEEKTNPEILNYEKKKEIAEITQLEISNVNDLLVKFN